VEKASATWPGIDAQSIPANHIDMCKFGDEDGSDYRSVADQLIQWITNIDKPRDPSQQGVPGLIAQVRYPDTLRILTAYLTCENRTLVSIKGQPPTPIPRTTVA
jgi:hypothetical protein